MSTLTTTSTTSTQAKPAVIMKPSTHESTDAIAISEQPGPLTLSHMEDEDDDFNSFAEHAKSTERDCKEEPDTMATVAEDFQNATGESAPLSSMNEGYATAIQTEEKETAKDSTVDDSTETTTSVQQTTASSPNKRYVTPQDFELLKVIGMGAFGKVLQVKNKKSKQILAMKVISKRLLKRKTSYVENIHAERDILTKVRHPFIVNMHCSFQTKEKLFIIMDFLAGGELFLRLGREGIFLESTAKFYVAEIVLALEHLHSRGILHRDLKPENILLASDGHLCLTDFGLAKDFHWEDSAQEREDGRALTICGTQEYMAPEMVAKQGYTKAADWWSLGCIAYEMLAGEPPFQSKKGAKDLFRKIMNERIRMPDGSSSAACKLLKGLLNRDASARLGAAKGTMFQVGGTAQVKQLEFFAGLDWTLLEKKEISPPLVANVEGENDLRHFYDEFTNMQLPRSVKEMTNDDFRPRQCRSDTFKGFSFIQSDFPLPDRTADEDEHYWNNFDEDGESASECASLLGGEEYEKPKESLKPTLETTPEVVNPDTKKKRPPRKKKKKKFEDDAIGDDDEFNTAQLPEESTREIVTIHSEPHTEVDVDPQQTSLPETESKIQDSKTILETAASPNSEIFTTSVNKPKNIQKSQVPKAPEWETVGVANEKEKKNDTKKKTSNTIAPKVTLTHLRQQHLHPTTHPLKPANHVAPTSVLASTKLPTAAPTKSAFPGQWAKQSHAIATHTIPSKSLPAPTTRTNLPSDWRDHKLNPKSTVTRQIKQPVISDKKEFPSLNDFPALGAQNPKGLSSSSNPQGSWAKPNPQGPWSSPKPQGAWARTTNGTTAPWGNNR